MGEKSDMESTQRNGSTPDIDSNVPRPRTCEPAAPEVEKNNVSSDVEEPPIEEPGYGHGV
jgi:hypothetical protein